MTEKMTVEQWLAIRKEAGLKIDPGAAEVDSALRSDIQPLWSQPAGPSGGI